MRHRPLASDRHQVNRRFLEIARDPRIIPGVHHSCDEWCDHCPLTDSCLVFRCTTEFRRQRRRPAPEPAFLEAAEAMQFAREIAEIDEALTAREDSSVTPGGHATDLDDDLVAASALEYATRSRRFIASAEASAPASTRGPADPKPSEVILRFHSRIYFTTTRALVWYRLVASGLADRRAAANVYARQTLACLDRSRTALAQFPDGDERRGLAVLLDTIARGIESRFPDARGLLRTRADIAEAWKKDNQDRVHCEN